MLSIFTVDSLADTVDTDPGDGLAQDIGGNTTLRAAIMEANAWPGDDTIEFDPDLAGGTITLDAALGQLQITSELDLVGLGATGLTIDAAGKSRVFLVGDTVTNATMSDLTITGGSTAASGSGGGILNYGTLSVTNATIAGNSAGWTGGGIRNEGTLWVVNSTISGNSTDRYSGGGIRNQAAATLWVVNSTISGNSAAEHGGGIFNYGTLSVVNSTIVGNTADANDNGTGNGGGVATLAAGSTTLHNTIVAGNHHRTDAQQADDDFSGNDVDPDSSCNLVGDAGSSGGLQPGVNGNIVGRDPRLAPLGDYGGPTQTHAPLPGSLAIDKGDNDRALDPDANPLTTDQRGFQRFLDGNGDATPTVDIGAFEFEPLLSPLVVSTYADEFDGDHRPGDLSLREALALAAINPGKDQIQFAPALAGETITLDAGLGELQITSDLDLLAEDAPGLTIDAAGNSRVFYIHTGVTDATISDLTITRGSTVQGGGGIYNDGTLSVVNSTISGNSADLYGGGGILNAEGTVSVVNSTISGNSAEYGGGIRNHGTLSVVNSTISGNSAERCGGGIENFLGTLSVVNSTISGNSADLYGGGGILNAEGTVSVVNSTISGNSASRSGGGINNTLVVCTLSVVNSTIVENTADADDDGVGEGGGVFAGGGTDVTTLHNTIVAGNLRGTAAPAADDLSGDDVQAGSSSNLVGDDATSGGLVDGDNGNIVGVVDLSWLAPLGDYGGPTQTHALLPGSPAIDAGDNDRATDAGLTEDQRGYERFLDGDENGTAIVDIGAFEFGPLLWPLVVSTSADELDGYYGPDNLTLREALSLAAINPGKDEIRFDPNLAGETITLEAALGELKITSNLDLLADGAPGFKIDAAGNSRVFYIHTGVTDATISDLTITGGSTVQGGGGGIYPGGGGIYNDGTLSVLNSTISANSAEYGGGIRNQATLSVVNSTISGNSADGGGGILNGGTLSVANSTISANSADYYGGGIRNQATLSVVNSTISGNSADYYGGGIYNDRTLSLLNSRISANSAAYRGGGIGNHGTLSVVNSTISGNSADEGGGICNGGTLSVVNSTISGNSAEGSGGGIDNSRTLSVVNSTIVGNTADANDNGLGEGGGVATLAAGSTTLHNTIVAGNLRGTAADDLSGLEDVQAGSSHNLVGDDATSGGLVNDVNGNIVGVADLSWLAPLADYGGPTQTHALLPGSPAIDKGDNARAVDPQTGPLWTDQRGLARFADGDGDGIARVDIGAFEYLASAILRRQIFYNNSAFDGNDPPANEQDDDAVAPDKQALLPGGTATFANYTSFSSGINGIMVDVANLPDGVTPTAEDFELKVGNSDDPAGWADAPPPTSITLRPGAGVEGSDRITLVWPDNVIQKQWLQVTIPAGGNLGLDDPDVFYYGNAVGESGNSTTDAKVNAYDMLGARDNQRTFVNPAAVDFNYDYNRDARVNAYDMLIARDNQTHFLNALKLITVPPSKVTTAMAETEGRTARDAVFERAVAAESGRGENSFGRFDWLYELEPTGAHKHPTRAQSPAEEAANLQAAHFLS